MFYNAALSVISYLVPAVLLGALYGLRFPLASVAALLIALSMLSAACSWATRSALTRTMAIVATYQIVFTIARGLDLFTSSSGGYPPRLRPELLQLNPAGYALIGILCAAAYAVAVWGVARMRRNGLWFTGGNGTATTSRSDAGLCSRSGKITSA